METEKDLFFELVRFLLLLARRFAFENKVLLLENVSPKTFHSVGLTLAVSRDAILRVSVQYAQSVDIR